MLGAAQAMAEKMVDGVMPFGEVLRGGLGAARAGLAAHARRGLAWPLRCASWAGSPDRRGTGRLMVQRCIITGATDSLNLTP